jgi:hypothetical protein
MGLGLSAQAGRPGLFWARFVPPFDLGARLFIASTFAGRHIHPFIRESPTRRRSTERKPIEGLIRRPEGGSEWEPIKILLLKKNSAYTPNSQLRIPTRVCQGHVVTMDLPTLGTNPK